MKRSYELAVAIIFGSLVSMLLIGLILLASRTPSGYPIMLMPSSTPAPISVYITGAVARPGVYNVPRDCRMVEAVALAGGFLEGAEVARLNLAEKLDDGQHIDVLGGSDLPTPQLVIGGSGLLVTPTPPGGVVVNLNSADAALLEKLPGIGPTTAEKIVQYREENGPFEYIEDLLKIPGIGPETINEIRGLVTVE